jgi:hypothetical protein
MTEQEQEALASRIADDSSVFDFDKALELVRVMPTEAETLLHDRERLRALEEEADRSRSRLRITIRELR